MSGGTIRALLSGVAHEAWINQNWEADGITWVVVARAREGGDFSVGAFLIDAWCLGVKDAYADEMSRGELDELLEHQLAAAGREAIEPACARKLIEGAIAFAQNLGFLPHRDFRKARKVLNGIDASVCAREFAFGHEGRVHFVVGPDDDEARVRRVLAVLDAKLGPESFDFTPFEEDDTANESDEDVDWDAVDAMFRFVESPYCPDRTLTGFHVSAFVSAAVMIDPDGDTDAWWRELFGGIDPALPDNDEFSAEEIRRGFLEEWIDDEDMFARGFFEPGLPGVEEEDHVAVVADHCRGFLRVFDARPELTAKLNSQPEAAAALATMRRRADAASGDLEAAGRRSLTPIVGEAMRTLWIATAPLRASES